MPSLRPDMIGVSVRCATCGHPKKPIGRDAPLGLTFCEPVRQPGDPFGCDGYREPPYPGSLWPGETEEEFGYPVGIDGTNRAEDRDDARD